MRAPLPPCSGFSSAGQRSPHCSSAEVTSLNARLRGWAISRRRMRAACADLLSSSEKAREPLSTRAPPNSSERIRERASGTARVLPRT